MTSHDDFVVRVDEHISCGGVNDKFWMRVLCSFKQRKDVSNKYCIQRAETVFKLIMDEIIETFEKNNISDVFFDLYINISRLTLKI